MQNVPIRGPNSRLVKGRLVAKALAGCWRKSALQDFELSSIELAEVTPMLYGSGAAALGWWSVRETALREDASALVLQQAYRLFTLQSAIHEQKIAKIFGLLRQTSVEAILVKGWAAAQLYPDGALRPYGDIDLLVLPNQFKRAEEIIASTEARDCWVDLHDHFAELHDRTCEALFNRSKLVPLGGEHVRVLSQEDHLALLSIHLLKHGAWRPLWLCDISAAIESLPPNFAWDLCLGPSEKRARWITAAIGLAHRLLGADLAAVPMARQACDLPSWLSDCVLKQWATPYAINQPPMSHAAPIATYLRHPSGIMKALRERWPNPILATVSINGQFNDLPRLPYQVGNCALRAGQFLLHLPTKVRTLN